MDVETAHDMLAWPHSGFHVHDGVWVAADDREFAVRLARYCARNPVALRRLVRACRLVALAVPDPGRAIGSRLLIAPG